MNPLMSELANRVRHEDLLAEAQRIREEQELSRQAARAEAERQAPARPAALARALALLASVITPW